MIDTEVGQTADVAEALRGLSEIEVANIVRGLYDIIAVARVETSDMADFVNKVRRIKGVFQANTGWVIE